VVGKKVVAAAKGESLWVTGDGKSNVIALCDSQINTDPRRGTSEDTRSAWSRRTTTRSCSTCSARA
jgi:hypothetical protein